MYYTGCRIDDARATFNMPDGVFCGSELIRWDNAAEGPDSRAGSTFTNPNDTTRNGQSSSLGGSSRGLALGGLRVRLCPRKGRTKETSKQRLLAEYLYWNQELILQGS